MFIAEIHGNPFVQKQTEFYCSCPKGRKCKKWGVDPSKKNKEIIQWQIKPFAPREPICGPVEVTMTFFLPIPKNTSAMKKRQMINRVILPDTVPDEDNLAYIVNNAMSKLYYDDDKRICAKHTYKYYAEEPKTVISVRPILTMEPVGLNAGSF